VRELADGRVHVGKAAADLQLIDGVQTIDATIQQLSKRKGKPMSADNTAVPVATLQSTAATIGELKAGCPGATPDFLMAQLEANATLAQAQTAWMREQQTRLQAAEQKLTETEKTKPAAAAQAKPGVDPVTSKGKPAADQTETSGDAVADFNAAVRAEMTRGVERRQATLNVARRNPDLHQTFLLASNPGRKQQQLIGERFENA
jgi:hypothetical protein